MTPEQTQQVKALRAQGDHVQIFNYVIDHLRAQGERSVIRADGHLGREDRCSYRGYKEDGGDTHTMCAVGALITDDEYEYGWEGTGIDQLLSGHSLPSDLHECLARHEQMLLDLQTFHDYHLVYVNRSFSKSSEDRVADLRLKWKIL